MCMDPGIDTGPTLIQRSTQILATHTAGYLAAQLSSMGADLLVESIPAYLSGTLVPRPQENLLATYAPMIKKEDGLLDFSQPASVLELKIRAFNPRPGAYTYWRDQVLKIHRAHVVDAPADEAGKKVIHQGLPAFTTGKGLLVIDELQPAGKNILNSKTFLLGARNWVI